MKPGSRRRPLSDDRFRGYGLWGDPEQDIYLKIEEIVDFLIKAGCG